MAKQEKGLLSEVVKYGVTASLGAIVAFAWTAFNRLPSRALTVLPAGIHQLRGPTLPCPDKTFITGEVNEYLETNIETPPCDVLLSRNQIKDLTAELERAKAVFLKERIEPLKTALDNLRKVQSNPPKEEGEFQSRLRQAVANLVYISRHAPKGIAARDLLPHLEKDVSDALADVSQELNHMQQIAEVIGGRVPQALKDRTEMYFVVDNSSDVEFYMTTHCSLAADGKELALVLEDTKNEEIPTSALVYLPILPGRGKLLKYSSQKGAEDPERNVDLKPVKEASLHCLLSTNKTITSRPFEPERFTVRDSTF